MLAAGGYYGFKIWRALYSDNVVNSESGFYTLYIRPGWNMDSLDRALDTVIIDKWGFHQLAGRMNLANNIIPGKYTITDDLGNRPLIRKLRSGKQDEIKILLKGSIDRKDILRELGTKLITDTSGWEQWLDTTKWLSANGYNSDNWPCVMMANTYFFYWASSPEKVFSRFEDEKKKFWNNDRMIKLKKTGLSMNEAIILASIVDAETIFSEEMPVVAGVYLNRLQKDWPLQADPTIRFMVWEKGRKRVLKADLKVEHPYNTYLNKGLPPGPVMLPSLKAIDAVLNASSHDYMFFCAKDDLSGYHLFTASAKEHERNAVRYHKALDARNIMR